MSKKEVGIKIGEYLERFNARHYVGEEWFHMLTETRKLIKKEIINSGYEKEYLELCRTGKTIGGAISYFEGNDDILDAPIYDYYLSESAYQKTVPVPFKWNRGKTTVSYPGTPPVRDEDDEYYVLVKGRPLADPEVTHGKGTSKRISEFMLFLLTRDYDEYGGGSSSDWIKAKGIGWVDMNVQEEEHEIHWYQHPNVGAVDIKIKREEGDMIFEKKNSKGNTTQIQCAGVLNESGILLESGETITSGKVVDLARKLSELWHAKDYRGFVEACGPWVKEFDDDDYNLLSGTVIDERGKIARWAIVDAVDFLDDEESTD